MKKIFVSLYLLLLITYLFATDVSGDQSGTWGLAGSPFNIIGEITVPTGFTLEIESGVEVIAMGNYKITALGNIIAEGTETDTIRFYGNNGLYWGGLRLENESIESIFDFCRISNTDDTNDYGIHSINSPVFIDHSFLDDHQKGIQFSALSATDPSYMEIKNSKVAYVQKSGITIVDNSNVLIDNCEITRCGLGASFYGAIQLSLQSNSHSCSPTISNNYIHHNDKQGLTLANLFGYDNMAPTVEYNEIAYNYTGIYLYVGKGTYTWNHIHHNFVENNADSGAGVMLYGADANATFTYNEIDHNYTGFYLTNGATVNLGDLNNASTEDDGFNCIYDNIFYDGTEYSIYNASASNVMAENTVWDDDPPIDVTIIDGNDVGSYGIVDYEPTLSPYAPPADFSAAVQGSNVMVLMPTGNLYPTYLYPESWNLYLDGTLLLGSMTSLFYIVENLSPGTHTFGVSYVYEGGYESAIIDTTIVLLALNPPLNAEVTPMGLLTWEEPLPGSSSAFIHYNIYRDSLFVDSTTELSWQFANWVPGVPYLVQVSAEYEDGESELIDAAAIPSIHNPPANVDYELFYDYIYLTWDPPGDSNVDVLEYQIYLDGVIYATTTELSCQVGGLTSGETYNIGILVLYVDGISSEPVELEILFTGANDIITLETKLIGNHPNPFNPITKISFTLSAEDAKNSKLKIYNLKGQKIKTYSFNSLTHQPHHSVTWDGTDQSGKSVSSGVYFYQLNAGEKTFTRKMLMIK